MQDSDMGMMKPWVLWGKQKKRSHLIAALEKSRKFEGSRLVRDLFLFGVKSH